MKKSKVVVGHSGEDLNKQIEEWESKGYEVVPDSLAVAMSDRIHRFAVVMVLGGTEPSFH